jgi:hypothetical protein
MPHAAAVRSRIYSTSPRSDWRRVKMQAPSNTKPTSESERKYPKLSGEKRAQFLKDWKKELDEAQEKAGKTSKPPEW